MLKYQKGQSALEYALVIGVAVLALLAVNMYMKKGIQGRLKESTDQIGRQWDATKNFETAWKTTSAGTTNTSEIRSVGGNITTTVAGSEVSSRAEYESFGGGNRTLQHIY